MEASACRQEFIDGAVGCMAAETAVDDGRGASSTSTFGGAVGELSLIHISEPTRPY